MAHSINIWRSGLVLVVLAIPLTAFATFPETDSAERYHLAGPGVANHPIGIKPSSAIKIPGGWNLAADGTLTCTTCHSTPPVGKNAARNLRGDANEGGKAFCLSCHADSESGPAMHWQALGKAHIMAQDYRNESPALREQGSRACMTCHDGISAPDAGHNARFSRSGPGDRAGNHPIGVRYPFGGKMRAEVPLRPASMVPATISLAGGVVSCTSCHNLYARNPQRLSVPIEGSQLCFACHDLN